MTKFILILLILNAFNSRAENFSGKDSMNDIKFSQYKDFAEKWQLVTIRFRKDTGEMRLTYGNELAIKTLKSGSINYPDGAVLAKAAFPTGADEQFISSLVPRGVRRYQLMVRDKKKYSQSGGWGYGLFDPDGKTYGEDPVITQMACYACHTIVENRGDVFSQPFSPGAKINFFGQTSASMKKVIKFSWLQVDRLPDHLRKVLPDNTKRVRMLVNKKLQRHAFQGTFDELKPSLEQESRKSKVPTIFLAEDKKRFVVLIPGNTSRCMDLGSMKVISTNINLELVVEDYCLHD